jgi:hypothetical protein
MPTQTAKDPSAREKIIAVLKDWRVLAGEVLAVGGSFLVGWAPPGHVGGVSSWATGLATGATLVVLIALAGNWPSRPTKVCTTRLRLFVAALALATIGLTVCYGQLLGELVYTWPEPGSAAATAPQRYIRGDALTAFGRDELDTHGVSPATAVDRAGGQPLVDQEALLWTMSSRLSAANRLTYWYVLTVCAWVALMVSLVLLGGKRLATPGESGRQGESPSS